MTGPMSGKVVIITGASSGVGEAAARAFARSGATVVLAARSAPKIAELAKELGGLAVPTDVTRLDDLRALIERTLASYGRIDVLVNNAAANARGNLDSLDEDAIASVIDTNLKAPMLLTRLALPHLRKTRGVVVNVASIAGHVPLPGQSPYTTRCARRASRPVSCPLGRSPRRSCSTISTMCRTWSSRSRYCPRKTSQKRYWPVPRIGSVNGRCRAQRCDWPSWSDMPPGCRTGSGLRSRRKAQRSRRGCGLAAERASGAAIGSAHSTAADVPPPERSIFSVPERRCRSRCGNGISMPRRASSVSMAQR